MAITIICPSCHKQYQIEDDRIGKKLKCTCGDVFRASGEASAPVTPTTSPVAPQQASQMFSAPGAPVVRAGAGQRFEVHKYEPDGGSTLGGTALLAVSGFCAAALLGALASFVGQWFYLVLVFPFAIGLGVGLASMWAIEVGRIRNRVIAGACAFLAGCVAMLVMHFCDYLRFQSTLREELAAAPPQAAAILGQMPELIATRQQQPPEIQRVIAELEKEPLEFRALLVRSFPGYVDYAAHVGVSIGRVHDVGKDHGLNLGYIGSYIYWVVEVLVVAGFAFFLASTAAAKPYCIQCEKWKKSQSLGSLQPAAEPAVEAIREGDLTRLHEHRPSTQAGEILVDAAICPGCRESGTIDLKVQRAVKNKKGEISKTELAHVTYPGSALAPLQSLFSAPAETAPAAPPPVAQPS
jgi:hypothetical protein